MNYDEDEDVNEALFRIDGGPPARPKPLYNDGLVQSIAALLEAGTRIPDLEPSQREELWNLFYSGKKLVDREIQRRKDKNKAAQKGR